MSKRKRTAKERVLERWPNAFCCLATWGGYSIWLRGKEPKRLEWGHTARQAWADAARRLERKP